MTKGYTLCANAMSYYSLDMDNLVLSDLMTNTAWYSEWDRVCDLDLSQPTPTIPFNTSIPLTTASQTNAASSQAAAGSTSTIVSASSTKLSTNSATTSTTSASAARSTATGLVISPDGTCGGTTGYTCEQSGFGDCCSIYGDWYVWQRNPDPLSEPCSDVLIPVVPPAIIVLRLAAMTLREFVQAVFPPMVSVERATTTGPVSIQAMETAATLMVTGMSTPSRTHEFSILTHLV